MDITAITGLASSLKTAADIAKAMVDLRDATAFQAKLFELQREILSAQSSALAANADQFAMLERIRQLEKRVAELEAWDAEKKKYKLEEVYPGAFAYTLTEDARTSEPNHWLCTNCYNRHRKSILQSHGRRPSDNRIEIYKCPDCKGEIGVSYMVRPNPKNPG